MFDEDSIIVSVTFRRYSLVYKGPLSRAELGGQATVTFQDPLGSQQTLHSHWTSGMNSSCTDTHFSAKTKPVPVGEPGGHVVEDASRVHPVQEVVGSFLVFGDNDVRVGRPVAVYVVDGLVHAAHYLDDTLKIAELYLEGLGQRRTEGEHAVEARTSVDADVLSLQHLTDMCEEFTVVKDLFMYQQRLHGIAG